MTSLLEIEFLLHHLINHQSRITHVRMNGNRLLNDAFVSRRDYGQMVVRLKWREDA